MPYQSVDGCLLSAQISNIQNGYRSHFVYILNKQFCAARVCNLFYFLCQVVAARFSAKGDWDAWAGCKCMNIVIHI